MLEKGKINAGEFLILVIVFTIGGSILTLPAPLTTIAKQDAWIASSLMFLIGLFFVFITTQLDAIYPSVTYVELNEKILGKWIGKTAALLFLFYLFHLSSYLIREMGSFFTTQILVETPIQMIMIMLLLTSIVGVHLGLEVICRSMLIFFPWIILLLLLLFLFLIPQIKLENIQPIFGEGMKPIIKGSYENIALPYAQFVILLMITPYVTEKKEMKKAFYKGALIGGSVLTILIIFSILVLGADITARQSYPSYTLGRKISIGNFLERIEVIVAIIWIFTIYFKLTICYYGLSLGLAQVLGLKSYKILLFPLGFLILTFSIFSHPDIVDYRNFIAITWTPYSLTICFFLPLLLLIFGKIKKKRSASKSAKVPVH
ncbi:endospore germination permease [Metabacillus litoralis]|uniref:GerAB/ArcD/ProY family transporter n=1 Tax=Metabacillus litoralis TaxID=152268 RepID=UPI00203BFF16|nr:endospore germination permease [Metabacillus litoralis]MCM3653484.1 spore germination protein [Metabacillus litoralis]